MFADEVVVVTKEEIDEVVDKAAEAEYAGKTEYGGMTYEQGVRAAIDWLFGDVEEAPL